MTETERANEWVMRDPKTQVWESDLARRVKLGKVADTGEAIQLASASFA